MQAIDPMFESMLARDANMPALATTRKPCRDCAVVHGFYRDISDALKNEPRDVQEFLCARWWCHETGLACRGNIDNVLGG